jgi:hypothetical protein
MKRRILLLIVLIALFLQRGLGQGDNVIALSIPAQASLDSSQMKSLENTVTDIITAAGYIGSFKPSNLVLVPSVTIEENVIRSEQKSLVVVDTRLSLNLRNIESGHIFSSISRQYRGIGKDRRTAISSALTSISATDKAFKAFLDESQRIVLAYYETNSIQIFRKAAFLVQKLEYEHAIALLMSIPENASCYDQAVSQSKQYYQLYRDSHCEETIRQIRTLCAGHQYREALDVLAHSAWENTQCTAEADALIAQIEVKITAEEMLDFQRKREETEKQMEQEKLNAIITLAEKYYAQMASISFEP